jgi:hypothetical protein
MANDAYLFIAIIHLITQDGTLPVFSKNTRRALAIIRMATLLIERWVQL